MGTTLSVTGALIPTLARRTAVLVGDEPGMAHVFGADLREGTLGLLFATGDATEGDPKATIGRIISRSHDKEIGTSREGADFQLRVH